MFSAIFFIVFGIFSHLYSRSDAWIFMQNTPKEAFPRKDVPFKFKKIKYNTISSISVYTDVREQT